MNVFYVMESGALCGGVRVIFEHAIRLQARGHKVVIASFDQAPTWFDLGDVGWWTFDGIASMKENLVKLQGKKIATWWKTASIVNDISKDGEGCYFIQDNEVSYYWRRAEKEMVLATYGYDLKHYTDEKWVADTMPGTFLVGQAYNAELYKPMKYVYPQNKRAIACVRKQALKGFGELGEFARRLGKEKDIALETFGFDHPPTFGGAFSRHYRGMPDSQIARMLSEGTVFVSTSLHEGFGLTMLEAMACGSAVATFDSDGNYFCVDGVNCGKVAKGDIEGLVDTTVALIRDEKLRKHLIQNGFDTARQFSDWTPVVDCLEEFLGK